MSRSQEDRDKVTIDTVLLLLLLVGPIVIALGLEAIAAWFFALRSPTWEHVGIGALIAVAVVSAVAVVLLNNELKRGDDQTAMAS
jgi:membrane protein YdbS with pleckstrin-like domain